MRLHARDCLPSECCGILGGIDRLLMDYYPLTNRAITPTKSFFAAPEELFEAIRRMRRRKQEHLGIYHSHPDSEAYPSATDVKMAFYPQLIYFIFSAKTLELRAFHIVEGNITPVSYFVVD